MVRLRLFGRQDNWESGGCGCEENMESRVTSETSASESARQDASWESGQERKLWTGEFRMPAGI